MNEQKFQRTDLSHLPHAQFVGFSPAGVEYVAYRPEAVAPMSDRLRVLWDRHNRRAPVVGEHCYVHYYNNKVAYPGKIVKVGRTRLTVAFRLKSGERRTRTVEADRVRLSRSGSPVYADECQWGGYREPDARANDWFAKMRRQAKVVR